MAAEQLRELARRTPDKYIHRSPSGGGDYVSHDVVTQRLLYAVGPFSYDLVEVLRGDVAAIPANPQGASRRAKEGAPALVGAVVGVLAKLTVEVDGRWVSVTEAGDCESPHNWQHDGQRMKDAMSDAIKRCAMRLGLALHLWSGEEYFLDIALARREPAEGEEAQS